MERNRNNMKFWKQAKFNYVSPTKINVSSYPALRFEKTVGHEQDRAHQAQIV